MTTQIAALRHYLGLRGYDTIGVDTLAYYLYVRTTCCLEYCERTLLVYINRIRSLCSGVDVYRDVGDVQFALERTAHRSRYACNVWRSFPFQVLPYM
jgi:hypothetical protein